MAEYDYAPGAQTPSVHSPQHPDPQSERIQRLLALPDLSRQPGSPVWHLVRRVLQAPQLRGADRVTFPQIISTERNFDALNTPADHPSRRPSDTYYVDAEHVLRTQMTSMWSWYLADARVQERLRAAGSVKAVSYGKVYRNDEIDRSHYPVFHQVDAVAIAARTRQVFDVRFLDELLLQIAHVVYGSDAETRILDDTFPFTEPSRQLEIRWHDEWLEVVGAGLVHAKVLERLGLDPSAVNGWAFGFGLDRLAMRKMQIPDIRILWSSDERITRQFETLDTTFTPVSKYPPTQRDVSFVVDSGRALNDFYEIVRAYGSSHGEDIVEQVEHVDRYENAERLGAGRVSHTFRITYRSFLRTLTNEEINVVQDRIRAAVESELAAVLR